MLVPLFLGSAAPKLPNVGQCFFSFGTGVCHAGGPPLTLVVAYDYSGGRCPLVADTASFALSVTAPTYVLALTVSSDEVTGQTSGWFNPVTGETLVGMCNAVSQFHMADGTTRSMPAWWDNNARTCFMGP